MPRNKVVSQKDMIAAIEGNMKRVKPSKKSGAVAQPRA